jgi:hypothetical protein
MGDAFYDTLARQHGFDTFRQWVEYEHTRRRVEENEYRVSATRLMWGDEAARRVKKELEASDERDSA